MGDSLDEFTQQHFWVGRSISGLSEGSINRDYASWRTERKKNDEKWIPSKRNVGH